ncbi:MAG: hypothetical protein R3C39_09880 [Dehalococcoidia bacterium]
MASALAFGILGGFALAVALPIDDLVRDTRTASWFEHAQVHGHLQAVGFAGLFIVGMAYRLMPGFGRRTLALPRLVTPSWLLLAAGVLLRTIGQPAADHGAFAFAMAAGAWLELAGAACFGAVVLGTSSAALRRGEAWALWFVAGTGWFVAQGVLGAAWLTELASDRGSILRGSRDEVLLLAQVYGLHVSFVLGVATRAFPTLFAAGTSKIASRAAPLLFEAGVLAWFVAALATSRGSDALALERAGLMLAAAGLVVAIGVTGAWKPASRLRDATRPLAVGMRLSMAWCAIVAMLLVVGAVQSDVPEHRVLDAARHAIGLGVVTTLIVSMAQMLLPEFAAERLVRTAGAWRGSLLAWLLTVAAVLRVGAALFAGNLDEGASWAMALAGTIALGVMIAFALLLRRAARGFVPAIELGAVASSRRPPSSEEREGG